MEVCTHFLRSKFTLSYIESVSYTHLTTAYDMALIAQELLKNETYRSMMSNTYYVIPPTNKQPEERPLHGQHQMLNESSLYYYEYAEGGKTGYTVEAQNTLVTYAKQGDTELIAVVLKCNGAQHYICLLYTSR